MVFIIIEDEGLLIHPAHQGSVLIGQGIIIHKKCDGRYPVQLNDGLNDGRSHQDLTIGFHQFVAGAETDRCDFLLIYADFLMLNLLIENGRIFKIGISVHLGQFIKYL